MAGKFFYHERLRRGTDAMRRVAEFPVTICGAGALGANIAEGLARQGFARLRLIDRDRIEERNLSTQPYCLSEIGALKAKMLSNSIYRAVGVVVDARTDELTSGSAAKLLDGSGLVIDAFDNSVGRAAIKEHCRAGRFPAFTRDLQTITRRSSGMMYTEYLRLPMTTSVIIRLHETL